MVLWLKKKFPPHIWAILGPKYRFFWIFSETTIEISSILRQSVEDDSAVQSQKALENLHSSSGDIWGHIYWACPGMPGHARPKNNLKKFPNGPIRKANMLKSKFDDIFAPAPLWGHPGSTQFFENCFFFKMVKFAKLSNTSLLVIDSTSHIFTV